MMIRIQMGGDPARMGSSMMTKARKDRFVYVGRIEKQKGIRVLLRAWRYMGGEAPRLVICGTGSEMGTCNGYLERERLSMVEMRGYVPNEEIKSIIEDSLALIMPTQWYEGFGMVVIEAYSVGTPVVGSDIGNVADLIKDGETGIHFRYDDPSSLARAVRWIQAHPLDPDHIREIYATYFTEQENYRILKDIYDAAVCGANKEKVRYIDGSLSDRYGVDFK